MKRTFGEVAVDSGIPNSGLVVAEQSSASVA